MIFGRIVRSVVGGISRMAGGVIGGLLEKTGLGKILDPIKKVLSGGLGGILDKLPFGGLLKKGMEFLGKLGPLAMLAGGPLGLVAGLAAKAGSLGNILNLAQGVLGKLGGSQALPAPAINNLAQIFAQNQARLMQF